MVSTQATLPGLDTGRTADVHPNGLYRYALGRRWAPGGTTCCWVMLNPSTADADQDDPTICKCIGFARRWGHSAITVVNLFAWRATDPRDLLSALRKHADDDQAPDPTGDAQNASAIRDAVLEADQVVCAWGAAAEVFPTQGRSWKVRMLMEYLIATNNLGALKCLGRTNGGSPRHPLMMAYKTPLETY